MKPETLALIQRFLSKLNEKSSVYGYLSILIGAFVGDQYDGLLQKIAAAAALVAGAILFLLSDAQVRNWMTGQKPADLLKPTVPPPQDK